MLEDGLRRDLPALAADGASGAYATLRIAGNADSLGPWFVAAIQDFAQANTPLIDLQVDDQDKTSDWLRRGHVLAAVTSLATPVQGCRSRKLGLLRYCATASPEFIQRWFAKGPTPEAFARAPSLVFDRNDRLQELWVKRLLRRDIALPVHRLPSTQAFVDASVAGIGWGLNPLSLVQAHLDAGSLVELVPERRLDVPLYWQQARIPLPELDALARSVSQVAQQALHGILAPT